MTPLKILVLEALECSAILISPPDTSRLLGDGAGRGSRVDARVHDSLRRMAHLHLTRAAYNTNYGPRHLDLRDCRGLHWPTDYSVYFNVEERVTR